MSSSRSRRAPAAPAPEASAAPVAPAAPALPVAFAAPPEGLAPGTYVSGEFPGTPNIGLRGNLASFGLALATGVADVVLPFCNPNRVGRGGCPSYASARFGPLDTYELSGIRYYRIADPTTREAVLAAATARFGGDARNELSRILRDYRECRATAGYKPSRIGPDFADM